MLEATLAAFEDELEKIAVTLRTAKKTTRHALRRLQDWQRNLTQNPSKRGITTTKSIEEVSAELPKTFRKSMLSKARYVKKHQGEPLTAPAFKGKKIGFVEPNPTTIRNIPR